MSLRKRARDPDDAGIAGATGHGDVPPPPKVRRGAKTSKTSPTSAARYSSAGTRSIGNEADASPREPNSMSENETPEDDSESADEHDSEAASSSQDSPSADSETDREMLVPASRIPEKPSFKPPALPPSDLMHRLHSFLPQMQRANSELEKALQEGREVERFEITSSRPDGPEQVRSPHAESDEEESCPGTPYIEMNLGLGVLEEQGGHEDGQSSSDDSGPNDENVMSKLMGRKGYARAVNIQEL